jgi:hypothetical protein
MTPNENAWIQGQALVHTQIGKPTISALGVYAPAVIGTLIGAVLGSLTDNIIAAAVCALCGMVLGIILSSVYNWTVPDESGAFWFWLNSGFVSALVHLPPVYWFTGSGTAWLLSYLKEFRAGNTWFVNVNNMQGP